MVDNAAQKAIAEAGGNLKLLLPIVKAAVKAETTPDGRLAVSVVDDSGKELVSAPREIGNATLKFAPARYARANAEVQWTHIGSYWMDQANTHRYPGHDLFNLRATQALDERWAMFARVMNLTDRRFADSASVSSGTAVYSPGLPRALYVGLEGKW